MAKPLVTGGAGLLGTALTQKLLFAGVDVQSTYFSRPPTVSLESVYKRYDFTRYEDCLAATEGRGCVFICAVQASGVKGVRQSPTGSVLPNLQIHANLWEACCQNGVAKTIWISSSTVYQEAFYPIREDQLDLNQPPYELYQGIGWVYRYLEQLAKCYCDKRGLKTGIIRTSNIYGPFDRFDDEKSHVIPALIKRALGKENPFIVWGNGSTVRDFVYVDDLTEAALKVAQSDCTTDPVNFSNGCAVSIRDLVSVVLEACEHDVEPRYDLAKATAVPYRVLDNTRFNTQFGEIRRTPLIEGIRETVEWYNSRHSRD